MPKVISVPGKSLSLPQVPVYRIHFMKSYRIFVVLVTAMIGTGLLYLSTSGGSPVVPDDQLQEIVYVDSKSGEAFLLRARSSPELHPETGEPTLIPGMYCEKCKAWKPVGSMEMIQTNRFARRCPIHKVPLLREGPLPEEPSS